MPRNAEPKLGDIYLKFNGTNAYVEAASSVDYSVSTTGELTVSVWMRPDTLNFPSVEPDSDYIHWLGKGDTSGAEGNQEWTFRMYNQRDQFGQSTQAQQDQLLSLQPAGRAGRRQLRAGTGHEETMDSSSRHRRYRAHILL